MSDRAYYYDLVTGQVISADADVKAVDKLGPYSTPEEAHDALQRLHDRNDELDAEEEAEREDR